MLVAGLLSMHPFFLTRADVWKFDPSMLKDGPEDVDLSVFNNGGQLPGSYLVDVVLNGKVIDSEEMMFNAYSESSGKSSLEPCLTLSQLYHYGLRVSKYPELLSKSRKKNADAEQCAKLDAIPQAGMFFDFYQRRLMLSVPQAALRTRLSGIAPVESWDDGVSAFLMNYSANVMHHESRVSGKTSDESEYVQLEPGINIGAWRFRNMTTWMQNSNENGKWQTAWNYAERGVNQIKSRLTIGDRYSGSEILEGVPFRGFMLKTDEDMLPLSEKEFGPVIHGIARTQARIEVKRSGYLIYTVNVPPGPFIIRDLPATPMGEDLYVTVHETDGQHSFVVPFSQPAIALREGYFKYDLMAGRYRPVSSSKEEPYIGQISFMYGLPAGITVFGGFQGSRHYLAASEGMGVSLDNMGAVSVDNIFEKRARRGQDLKTAQALRVRYSKNIGATNTGLYLTANRYSSSGYYGMASVLDSYESGTDADSSPAKKSRMSLTLSQSLHSWGSLSLAYSKEKFWNSDRSANELSATWGSSYGNVSWAISWAQRYMSAENNKNESEPKMDRQLNFWLSMPLDTALGGNTRLSYQLQNSPGEHTRHEIGMNGDGFERQLAWDVRQQITSDMTTEHHSSSQLNLAWRGGYGDLRGSYGISDRYRQINAGISGGLVIHQHGLTMGQPLGNAVALVEVPGASEIDIKGRAGVRTDFRGYTTLGYLSPYQENVVTLNPDSLGNDLEILNTDAHIVPTAGAVVPVRFRTRSGGKGIISISYKNGLPVPFGSMVTVSENDKKIISDGIVGDKGEVYLSGLPGKGILRVITGSRQPCLTHYRLPQKKGPGGIYLLKAVCS